MLELFDKRLTTTSVVYYMPDHPLLLQEFWWQTLDVPPRFPRVHRFLNFWRKQIEAPIYSVQVCCSGLIVPVDVRVYREVGHC